MRSFARKIVFLIAGFIMLAFSLWWFKIGTLECRLDTHECPPVVLSALDPVIGRSLFFSDLRPYFTHQPVLAQYQVVKTQKKLPQTLTVSLISYPTTYQLHFMDTDTTYIVNAQRQLSQEVVPELVTITTSLAESELVDAGHLGADVHLFSSTLVRALAESELYPTELELEDQSTVRIGLKGGINGIISNKSIQQQVTQLAFIEKNFDLMTIDQGIKVVDVRYTLPVLRTTETW